MKKFIFLILCIAIVSGCNENNKSVPVQNGRFQIAYQDLIKSVDKINVNQDVPKLTDAETTNVSTEDGVAKTAYITGESVRVILIYEPEKSEIGAVNLLYNLQLPQEDAAKQLDRYLTAIVKTLSPEAQIKVDIFQTLAKADSTTTYVEGNLQITVKMRDAGSILQIAIEPNE